MEVRRTNFPCDPCRCLFQRRTPPGSNYFYSEKIKFPFADNTQQKPTHSRPSSAKSVKSSPSGKKTRSNSSKLTSSDSKLPKKRADAKGKHSSKDKKMKIDPKSADELREELRTIKQQLLFLSERKNEALNVTNLLETRYKNLKDKCDCQEREIEELRRENEALAKRKQNPAEGLTMEDAVKIKAQLDEYEKKLNFLYHEFIDASSVMEQSKEKINRSLKEKDYDYQELIDSNKELSKEIEMKGIQYEKLVNNFKQVKEKEQKLSTQNTKLSQKVQELEKELEQSIKEVQKTRQEVVCTNRKHQAEMEEKVKACSCELQSKMKEINELNMKLHQMQQNRCQCKNKASINNNSLQVQYDRLAYEYQQMINKVAIYEQDLKKRTEETEVLKRHEQHLISELEKLQNFCERLSNISAEHNAKIARLNSSVKEKDTIINRQKMDLASKSKQIELLQKNEERLKGRVVELQEEMVSMRISSNRTNSSNNSIPCAEDCTVHLTEELEDLITALYEEIDKTSAKDEQIQKQNKNICYLQCALAAKDKELNSVRNELKIFQDRFGSTLTEKQMLGAQRERMKFQSSSESEELPRRKYTKKCPC